MVVGIFLAFASMGFAEGLNRFIPVYLAKNKKDKINYLVSISSKLFLLTGLISATVLFFSANIISTKIFHNPALSIYLKIFAFTIPFNLYTYIYYSLIRGNEKISAYSFGINILQNLVKLVALGLIIILGINVSASISFSYSLGIVSMTLFGYFYCKYSFSLKLIQKVSLSKETKKYLSKEIFSYSWPLFLFSILSSLIFWIDTFCIGVLKDSYWVGIYNSALPIALLLLVSSEIFMQLFFPLITKELSLKNKQVASELSKQIVKWTFIINVPVLTLIYFFPGVFINFFWGKEYLLASNSLRFLAIGYFIFSLANVSINLLSSKGKSKIILLNLLLVSFLNFGLNFLLIPRYGIDGASFATMFCLIIWSVLLFIESYIFVGIIPLRRKLLNVFLSAFIPALLIFYYHEYFKFGIFGLILFGFLYGTFYLFLIFITNSLDKNDLRIVHLFLSQIKNIK
jgi:O-antigen/teichoic acid export membrane protein